MPKKKTSKNKEVVHKITLGEKTGDQIIKEYETKERLLKLKQLMETYSKNYANCAEEVNALGYKVHLNQDYTVAFFKDVVRDTIGEIKPHAAGAIK